ncbi:oxidoreductase [Magnetococcus sp. PR-3]|uniref:oxidoreductase n=1 Tax=Magnetococcus sp. PR-3 TaxID=3120355 RepID=UPI002FCE554C
MATLPEQTITQRIYAAWERRAGDGFRPHLGASIIGDDCERAAWLSFRWATLENKGGRMLRLLDRGQREEAVIVADLKRIGVDVREVDATGNQYRVEAHNGHFGGSMDGVGHRLPEMGRDWFLLEFKTSNDKNFKKLVKDGVRKAKPEHYAQMQVYMKLGGLTKALYVVVNKNDDTLYTEVVELDEAHADYQISKARDVIVAMEPPPRLHLDPTWYRCKHLCKHHGVCHSVAVPVPTCRSCTWGSPMLDGHHQGWQCMRNSHSPVLLDLQQQKHGCEQHLYAKGIITWAENIGITQSGGVTYKRNDNGGVFVNGTEKGAWSSIELYKGCGAAGVPEIEQLKEGVGVRVLNYEEVSDPA